jgi:hypothetical protein
MSGLTSIRTGRPEIDSLVPRIRSFLEQDILDVVIDGQEIRGYRTPDARSIWIRDHCDMMRGFRHFERDLTSAVEHFAETQGANGRIFDYFTIFPEKPPSERENWTKYVRVPVEADVEYRFVKAVFLAWQASGDDGWVRGLVPAMERALAYSTTHPWRWDEEHGLVKRAYTIDTWDFAYTAGVEDWLHFRIDDHTFWGFLHGDNSGLYEAFLQLAFIHEHLGNSERAAQWTARAEALKDALNRTCFNGKFYTHFVKLTPVEIDGVDEASQLSLSNPMDINRGVTTHAMAVSIIEEYRRRRETTDAFAEWFSIDPPFPDGIFGDEKLVGGAYCNGGIMPLVGGELARAAFEHGFEAYGVDILRRYHDMIAEADETYLWYFPDGTAASIETSTSPEASATDGWGSSAMFYALIEGLAGVVDLASRYARTRISPRWLAAGVEQADVRVGYECSETGIEYHFALDGDRIRLDVEAPCSDILAHVLLPHGTKVTAVTKDGSEIPHRCVTVESSPYVDFEADALERASFEIRMG